MLHRFKLDQDNITTVFIFVHGFAVRWHSKKLFTDIYDQAPEDTAAVMISLYDYDDKDNCTLNGLGIQLERVQSAYAQIKELQPQASIILVGHSMGCGVAATALAGQLVLADKFVLLAPAKGSVGQRISDNMLERDGSYIEGGQTVFKRKNGSLSRLSKDFVDSFSLSFDDVYQDVLPAVNHSIILADKDKYSQEQLAFFNDHGAITITEADHNFSDDYRQQVVTQFYKSIEV